jgi:transcriptional regulator with XRE-family HTH domain
MPDTQPRTKLAALRLDQGLSQQEMARRTGLSIATYQRLERGDLWNPPLRYLVNCALVLGVELEQVFEDSWREWHTFSAHADDPRSPDADGKGR